MVLGPVNFLHQGFGDLAIDVKVGLPKSVVEAAKLAPSIARQFPAYAHEFQKETARVSGVADAVNITVQTLGVGLLFGGIVIALLMREKKKG